MNNKELINKLTTLIEPIVINAGFELYHIEFVKECGENYLRIYIDNDKGISLEDCEKVSRPVSDMLDIEDPISQSYYLEVSSPGIFRNLYTDKHLNKYLNYNVDIKLSELFNGKKKYEGTLKGFTEEEINFECDNIELSIPRDKISAITLKGEM